MQTATKALLLDGEVSPAGYFSQCIREAQEEGQMHLPPEVEGYVVNLMCEFIPMDTSGVDASCLALLLQKAQEAAPAARIFLFKKLADTALFQSGFFPESFVRKTYGTGYYISMGESAFHQLSHLVHTSQTPEASLARTYAQMCRHFARAVEILSQVSQKASGNQRNTLGLYWDWLETGSRQAGAELLARGIGPVPMGKKHMQ